MVDGELHCNVLFFAGAAEAVGCREIQLTIPIGTTARDAFDIIARDHEQFTSFKDCCAVAINLQICSIDTVLQEGCTLAFLPPVSGG